MKDLTKLKEEWQVHNRDHGLSWNEIAEMFNQIESLYKEDAEKRYKEAVERTLKIFIQVDASKGLPPQIKEGRTSKDVHVIYKDGENEAACYNYYDQVWEGIHEYPEVKYWLKETTLSELMKEDAEKRYNNGLNEYRLYGSPKNMGAIKSMLQRVSGHKPKED
jgi:hypothetical protein